MKGNLLQGTAKGRMGDIVAKVVHGKQIFAKHQPHVAQPRTQLQELQKKKFYHSVEFTKDATKTASLKLPYSAYLGSAKNMRTALIKESLLAFDCMPIGGVEIRTTKPRQTRIFNKELMTNWGNKFEVEIDPISGRPSIIGTNQYERIYFGSDIPLEAKTFDLRTIVINTIKPINGQSLYEAKASNIDDLDLQEEFADNPVDGKILGIFDNVNDCGKWNFYYSFNYKGLLLEDPANIMVNVGSDLPSVTPGKYQCVHLMVINRDSLLSYDFEEYYKEPAPTPIEP